MDETTLGVLMLVGLLIAVAVGFLKWRDSQDLQQEMTPEEREVAVAARTQSTVTKVHNFQGTVIGVVLIMAGIGIALGGRPILGVASVAGGVGILWLGTLRR